MAYPVSSIPTLSSLAPPLEYFEAHLRQHVISQIFLNVSGDKDSSLRKGKKKKYNTLNYRDLRSQVLASHFLLASGSGKSHALV